MFLCSFKINNWTSNVQRQHRSFFRKIIEVLEKSLSSITISWNVLWSSNLAHETCEQKEQVFLIVWSICLEHLNMCSKIEIKLNLLKTFENYELKWSKCFFIKTSLTCPVNCLICVRGTLHLPHSLVSTNFRWLSKTVK